MILYTIQKEFKYQQLLDTGILKADDNIICFEEEFFYKSYKWLENKMCLLLPKATINTKHPIWSWYKYCGKSKPDMRKYKSHFNKNEVYYRITFEINDNEVLLTDYDNWHLILNATNEDFANSHTNFILEEGENLLDYPEFVVDGDKIKYDWNKIIVDINSILPDIQATVWCIKKEQILKVEKFIKY